MSKRLFFGAACSLLLFSSTLSAHTQDERLEVYGKAIYKLIETQTQIQNELGKINESQDLLRKQLSLTNDSINRLSAFLKDSNVTLTTKLSEEQKEREKTSMYVTYLTGKVLKENESLKNSPQVSANVQKDETITLKIKDFIDSDANVPTNGSKEKTPIQKSLEQNKTAQPKADVAVASKPEIEIGQAQAQDKKDAEPKVEENSTTVKTITLTSIKSVYVRVEPKEGSNVVKHLKRKTKIDVIDKVINGAYYELSDKSGFVHKSYFFNDSDSAQTSPQSSINEDVSSTSNFTKKETVDYKSKKTKTNPPPPLVDASGGNIKIVTIPSVTTNGGMPTLGTGIK